MSRVFQACDEIIALCVARNGSITGEHGVGIEKRRYMTAMYSGTELSAMLDLKRLFDPQTLLNPGKIFPDVVPAPVYATPQMPTGDSFAPTTAAEAAAGLAALSAAGRAVRITSQPLAQPADQPLILTTRNLTGIQTFALEDLYITVGAGTPVQEVSAFLAEKQMQIALVSPWAAATVGDLLGANLNAPQRLRYGALRDNLLSTTVALADGRVIQAGRVVVKNVAGYDLPKLFVGAYGTLGLMVDVTLKLYPLPRHKASIGVPVATVAAGMALINAIAGELRVSAGVVLCPAALVGADLGMPHALVITAEGIAEDVASELSSVQRILVALANVAPVTVAASATDLWRQALGATAPSELLVRVGVPVKSLGSYLAQNAAMLPASGNWIIDPLHGLLYLRYQPQSVAEGQGWLAAVRDAAEQLDGYAVALAVPAARQGQIDRWGYRPAIHALMGQLQQRWDPAGIFSRPG